MSEIDLIYKGIVGPISLTGNNIIIVGESPQVISILLPNIPDGSMANVPIKWITSNVPNQIQNATYNSLKMETFLGQPLFDVDSKTSISFQGTQYYDAGSTPETTLTVRDERGNSGNITKKYRVNEVGGGFGTAVYDVVDMESFANIPVPDGIIISATNLCEGCSSYSLYLSQFLFSMNITVTLKCGGQDLENSICTNYCNFNADQRKNCLTPYVDYCFGTDPQIQNSIPCQNFFKNYNEEPGPDSRIDTAMSIYCNSKYEGFGSLFSSGDSVDIDVCACHMPEQQYENYVNEVIKLFPNFGSYLNSSGINPRCLLAQCAGSDYKTTGIGKVCNIPKCITIASFTNSGTFDGGDININQTGNCENIKNGDTGGGILPGEKSWLEKHWVWLVLGIGILVVLIIVILIVLAGESNKKKPKLEASQL